MTRRRLLAVVLALPLLLGACGLTEDDGPNAIAPENLPPDLLDPNPGTSTTVADAPGSDLVSVWFLEEVRGEVRLVEVQRSVQDRADPGDRLVALFQQPTEEEAAGGIVTSIPADTTLRAMPVLDEETSELVLDLSSEFLSIEGPEVPKAFAQIVWSVTDLDGVRRVRFLVDGEEIPALDAVGAEQPGPVSRANYTALAPART